MKIEKKIEALPVTIGSLFKQSSLTISTYCHFLYIVETSIYVWGQEMVDRSAQ